MSYCFDEIRLDTVRTLVQAEITDSALSDSTSLEVKRSARGLLIQLESRVFGSAIATDENVVIVPASWWDHFKAHMLSKNYWWMRWLRWTGPPSYKRHVFKVEGRLVFPDIPPGFREEYRSFVIYDKRLDLEP